MRNSMLIVDGGSGEKTASKQRSLKGLREIYTRNFEGSEVFRSQYADVAYFVQALESQNDRLDAKRKGRDAELDDVFQKLLSLVGSIYPHDVENMRETGLTNSRILEFVLRSYRGNSTRIIELQGRVEQLSNQIAGANQAFQLTKESLRQENEFRRMEQAQYHQNVEDLNKEHRRKLEEQNGRFEAAKELQQRSHAHKITNLTTSHSQKIGNLTTNHEKEIHNLTEDWNAQRVDFNATISRLQIALLRPVDSFEPLTDGKAGNRLEDLRNLVRTLARTSMEDVDPDRLGEAFGQVSFIQSGKKQGRKYILESVLWTILAEGFFAHPFSVFGDHGDLLSTTWTRLFGTDSKQNRDGFQWPDPTATSETWRYTTCEALQKTMAKPHSEKHIWPSHENHLVRVADSLAGAIARVSSKSTMSHIESIVDKASSLALEFSVQRCRLQLFTPKSGDIISTAATEMYDILSQSDTENGYGGTVALAVMPGLRKTGDAKGAYLDKVSILRPAAVYLKIWS
jgi:hypothetical protein